ncbi:TolC family protein [Candidatus Contendibacter odensensis]|uniref:Outer membrane protein n=1 Tax=Candidatus Contendobacter odensis Run_B_J11 TaxID=1400861 RepID=A0A7U7GG85_9GAMM|nr:TolC family protein [Candidatus Contendobacter odensis]CDH47826.1 putative Outer membrane protein [Candidatus Contendobacter odensis Run_B_J11]
MHSLRKTGCALALLALPLGGYAAKPAADLPGATLPELLIWAEQHNPELTAMQHDVEAAEARVQPAGALPDPMFSVEWRDIPNDSDFTLAPARVGSMKYTVAQTLPLGGKLESKQRMAEAEVEKAHRQRSTLSAALRAKLITAFIQRYQAQQNEILLKEELMFLHEIERVAQIRHANGLTPQQDALKAQIEQTTIKADLIMAMTEQQQARAKLNALLSRPANAPLAEPKALPPMPKPAALADTADRAISANPELLTQAAAITAAQQNQRLVQANRYPDLTVSVSPIQVGNRLADWELMLSVNIPLQQTSRRSQEREAAEMLSAAQLRQDAIANQVQGDLQEQLAGLDSAREQEKLIRTSLLPQADLTFQAALASYQTGRVDFTTLLDAQRQMRRARFGQLKALLEQYLRLAEIERLVGAPL